MRIEITLKAEARESAKAAMRERGIPVPIPFFGPVFEDCCMLHDHFNPKLFFGVGLNDADETEYFYPLSDIARLKIV